MARRPLVAIPTYHLVEGRVQGWVSGGFGLPERYVHALRRAGARPVLLPGPDPGDAADVLAPFDAVVLAGGGDVDPGRYGGEQHPSVYGVDPDRDGLEVDLALATARLGVPTLAVCRGMQVVNVAFGGTLLAHVPDVDGLGAHGSPVGGSSAVHDVKSAGGSRLEAVCGPVVRDCVSHHHQAVDRLGRGLVPVAWTDDGLVEAVEREDPAGAFFIAVQWHPEMTAATDPAQQALFDALVAATRTA
ncbi:MAG TPA: gamma-glutamyl-gamma-aminobutyrate hydrolase family protein [Acidimicrobiales bacterium]|nr:gamma-glutamyl-gamma-aminobutyrate hydrolase family protein [Acidimicrobiales bacterium]